MLLKSYKKEIIRPRCNPSFQELRCIAHLDQDISNVLPYLNAVIGGQQFSKDPPSLTIMLYGKRIILHPKQIAISKIENEEDADKILQYLKDKINTIWEKREQIKPKFETPPKPSMIEILKLLPKTNCKKCGFPTCMVFAAKIVEGEKGAKDCPEVSEESRKKLEMYLSKFSDKD